MDPSSRWAPQGCDEQLAAGAVETEKGPAGAPGPAEAAPEVGVREVWETKGSLGRARVSGDAQVPGDCPCPTPGPLG